MTDILEDLGLSDEQKERRRSFFNSSEANILMKGGEGLERLYREKIGEVGPDESLDDKLQIQLGRFLEPFNRAWFTKMTGIMVTTPQREAVSKRFPWQRSTLDGMVSVDGGPLVPFEGKVVGGYQSFDEVVAHYQPQVHHQMFTTDSDHAVLSVIIGNRSHVWVRIGRDDLYMAELLDRIQTFWDHVQSRTPLPSMTKVEPPPAGPATRRVNFTGNNQWASFAVDWLENRDRVKTFETAKEGLKAMIDKDVGVAFGHGVTVKRNRAGSLLIKADNEEKEAA